MFGPFTMFMRQHLPAIVLGLACLQTVSGALQLLLAAPEFWMMAVCLLVGAGLLGAGAWALYKEQFWARGFGMGALLSGGLGAGLWFGAGLGLSIPAALLSVVYLWGDGAAARFEQSPSFLKAHALSPAGARRLFLMGLGLGVGLVALLCSPLSFLLLMYAPAPTLIAGALGILGLVGLTQLKSWSYFAVAGSVIALLAAVVMGVVDGRTPYWALLTALALFSSLLPLSRPVSRALAKDD